MLLTVKLCFLGKWGDVTRNEYQKLHCNLGLVVARQNIAKLWGWLTHRRSNNGVKIWIGAWELRRLCMKAEGAPVNLKSYGARRKHIGVTPNVVLT